MNTPVSVPSIIDILQNKGFEAECIVSGWIDRLKSLLDTKATAAELKDMKAKISEYEMLLQIADDEACDLRQEISSLQEEISRLNAEHLAEAQVRSAEALAASLLAPGKEKEKFKGEIHEILVSVLSSSLNNLHPDSRRADIIRDILASNPDEHHTEQRAEQVKQIFRNSDTMTKSNRRELAKLGLNLVSQDGSHYKLRYYDDPRYQVSIGKTPSDYRAGRNNAAEIIAKMF